MKFAIDDLRTVTILQGLPDWQLGWFCDRGERLDLAPDERLFERGHPADFMFLIVAGAIQRYEEIGGQWLAVARTERGEVTGMLPYSRMTHYPGYTVATESSQVLRVRKDDFQEMLAMNQELGRRLVGAMADRVRGDVRLEQQRERMVALGRLSAGLAHELNNPAAAARRAADSAAGHLTIEAEQALRLLRQRLSAADLQAIEGLRRVAGAADLSSLQRSTREETIQNWLEAHDVPDPWGTAGVLADAGVTVDRLEAFANDLPASARAPAVGWIAHGLAARQLVDEIGSAVARISELVAAVKTYSHMDRSTDHAPTDVRDGLDNTLTMLGHRCTAKGATIVRRYQEDLPSVEGNPGELNQVWTNLIDNALDAIDDGGTLWVAAEHEERWIAVKVIDDGHGIPEAIRSHIFEPFFTTKAVGDGAGLGLDIAKRIVETHGGHIEVQSTPGLTSVCVRLPAMA